MASPDTTSAFPDFKSARESIQAAPWQLTHAASDGTAIASKPLQAVLKGLGLKDRDGFWKAMGNIIEKSHWFEKRVCTEKFKRCLPFVHVAVYLLVGVAEAALAASDSCNGRIRLDPKVVEIFQAAEETMGIVTFLKIIPDRIQYLESKLEQFTEQWSIFCLFLRDSCKKSFFDRVIDLFISLDETKVDEFEKCFQSLKESIQFGTNLQSTFVSARISEKVDITYLRQQLDPDMMDAGNRPKCLPGTQTRLVGEIHEWLFSEAEQNILWLYGVAGCGKSALSMTISEICSRLGRRGAYLFFKREKSNPNAVIRTIAFWLASFDRNIRKCVEEAVMSIQSFTFTSLETQFEKLLLEPLENSMNSISDPVVVILDGLDECGSYEDRRMLIEIIKTGFPRLPRAFRFLITSRPEPDLTRALSSNFVHRIDFLQSPIDHFEDVARYIDHELRRIFEEAGISDHPDWWRNVTSALASMANGFFLWASLAIKQVQSSRDDPVSAIESLLSCHRSGHVVHCSQMQYELDNLYETVLRNSGISWGSHDQTERFSGIFGLLYAKEPLSIRSMDNILGFADPSSSWTMIRLLRSVLTCSSEGPSATVQIFHNSFSEFLLRATNCPSQPWSVPSRLSLVQQCFDIMEDKLRFNICDLTSSFVRNDQVDGIEGVIADKIPAELEYACRVWAQLLCDIPHSPESTDLLDRLDTFAKSHLLHWFEVLSLSKHFGNVACRALREASRWTKDIDGELSSFFMDARKLACDFSIPISQSVPHIYLSAISLYRWESIVADHYSGVYPTAQVQDIRRPRSRPSTIIRTQHSKGVYLAAFSADGRSIASCSCDDAVCMWNVESGEIIFGPMTGHGDLVKSVSLSPDLRFVASGLANNVVIVWDATNEQLISGPLRGHDDRVQCVAFSKDGKRIASGSDDHSVCVWDIERGELTSGPLEGHKGRVMSVCFSPDGRRVASGSTDTAICVWDVADGDLISEPFEGHEGLVASVCFSPSGNQIASGSSDKTICIWDVEKGDLMRRLIGHCDWIRTVSYSPDGKHIVSGSDDKTVRIWSSESGKLVYGPFRGHNDWVRSVTFSPDGNKVASASEDATICVWDLNDNRALSSSQESQALQITLLAFARGGSRIAFGCPTGFVYIWDSNALETVSRWRRPGTHQGCLIAIAFSSEGRCVASAWSDNTVAIWDTVTGSVDISFAFQTSSVTSIAFLPFKDVVAVVSGSRIELWYYQYARKPDVAARAPPGRGGYTGTQTLSITFPVDGERLGLEVPLACTAEHMWGDHMKDGILGISFSLDAERMASWSTSKQLYIWEIGTHATILDLIARCGHGITSASFCPDRSLIVSGCEDGGVRVWKTENGHLVAGPFEDTAPVLSVTFSDDGLQILSGARDLRVRVWDLEYGQPITHPGNNDDGDEPNELDEPLCSNVSDDGWLVGPNGELLVWLPEDRRPALSVPPSRTGRSLDFSAIKIGLTSGRLGTGWSEGYTGIS